MKTFIKFILTVTFFLIFYTVFCCFALGLFVYNWYIREKDKIIQYFKK